MTFMRKLMDALKLKSTREMENNVDEDKNDNKGELKALYNDRFTKVIDQLFVRQ